MSKKSHIKGWLRISKLADLSGVPAATIKHYVLQGLLPAPVKTGKTMAYYDPACVDRIQMIKRLQRDRFLPLEVIRRLMESGTVERSEEELGHAMARTYLHQPGDRTYFEKQIRNDTGLSRKKLQALETHKLISPAQRKGRKTYDALDLAIAKSAAARESLGLPFDFSVETMQLYRNALESAVRQDVRRFLKRIMNEVPMEKAVSIIREADAELDHYIVQARRKILSEVIQNTLLEINQLGDKLQNFIFIEVPGAYLPAKIPEESDHQVLYLFFRRQYAEIAKRWESKPPTKPSALQRTTLILANLFLDRSEEAIRLADLHLPAPDASALEQLATGLTLIRSAARAPGFTQPVQRFQEGINFIRRAESKARGGGPESLFVRYVCGVVYFTLPEVLAYQHHGLGLLEFVNRSLRKGVSGVDRLPPWLTRTLCRELFPKIQINLRGLIKQSQK